MKAIAVDAANSEKTDFRAVAQRHKGRRADFVRILVEQECALRVPDFSATGAAALEEGAERF